MPIRRILALASATLALVLIPSAVALAAGTTVTVRVEGAKRTLLAPTVVHTHAGFITKAGAPAGSCPATGAAGALDLATHHHWGGTYSPGLGIELTSIFGEKHSFSSPSYWEIWVNNVPANFGICQQKLVRGDHLLFAPAPDKGTVYPTGLKAPATAATGHAFRLDVLYYNIAGKAKPLAKARVSAGKYSAVTNAHGVATVDVTSAGHFRFTATEKGYIRSVPVTVHVA